MCMYIDSCHRHGSCGCVHVTTIHNMCTLHMYMYMYPLPSYLSIGDC